jgi:predicted nucleotidyltransferase
MVQLRADYPTAAHAEAADAIVRFFGSRSEVDAILLVNSCARGKATADSCLDMVVLAQPDALAVRRAEMEAEWQQFYADDPRFAALHRSGAFSAVHLDIVDGCYTPIERTIDDGPDAFELEVGNHLAYSVALWERGDAFAKLKARLLPYYDEAMARERQAAIRGACLHYLAHIPLYVPRGLYFQAFDRLYVAFQLFLQALFIARRTYPIAYNKWIREQIVDILGLPELYRELPPLLEVYPFESDAVIERGRRLEALVHQYIDQPSGGRQG